jgi:hypothetical protein
VSLVGRRDAVSEKARTQMNHGGSAAAGSLGARYHEILSYRIEGLRKYGGRLTSDIYGPPCRVSLPTLTLRAPVVPSVKIGPFHVGDNPPVLAVLRRCVAEFGKPSVIVEIGPGKGTAAGALRAEFAERITAYFGLDRDEAVDGPYEKVASIDEIDRKIDLVVASHVIEHMAPDAFFDGFLTPLLPKLERSAAIVVATPNALSPASIFGDFTHVQGYAWYDLYALLRLFFETVDVVRSRYLWSPARLSWLLPRIALTRALELDWCEEIICTARRPRSDA